VVQPHGPGLTEVCRARDPSRLVAGRPYGVGTTGVRLSEDEIHHRGGGKRVADPDDPVGLRVAEPKGAGVRRRRDPPNDERVDRHRRSPQNRKGLCNHLEGRREGREGKVVGLEPGGSSSERMRLDGLGWRRVT
jgi:hypothetical protein